MDKERMVIYVQANESEAELMKKKMEAQNWVSNHAFDTSIIILVTEGAEDGVGIWERQGVNSILTWVKNGMIDSIFVPEEEMLSKRIDERLLFYHFVQLFGCKVRTKNGEVIDLSSVEKYLHECEKYIAPAWFRNIQRIMEK